MNKALMVGVLALVLGALIWGFTVVGGPSYARMENADRQRLTDLNRIHSYLLCPKAKRSLPETLATPEYCPNRNLPKSVSDPKTGADYTYRRVDDTRFEICAEFELPKEDLNFLNRNRPVRFDGNIGCMTGTTSPIE